MSATSATWTDALDNLIARCVPKRMREAVLLALLAKERKRSTGEPLTCIDMSRWDKERAPDLHPQHEASSVMIQVLVRSIINNNSKQAAAAILFRGRLADYLDGLPGIKVDRKKCVAMTKEPAR
jgi:hypothetical protein